MPRRTSLPQVTEGGGDSEDEDSLQIKPLPAYCPEKSAVDRFGSIDSDSGIFAGIENLTKDILAFVEEPGKMEAKETSKMEVNQSKRSVDVNHNTNAPGQRDTIDELHDGIAKDLQNKDSKESSSKYNASQDSSGVSCHGDNGYKSAEAENILEQKPSCKQHNKSVMDASQGTLLGTAEFCPQTGTLVGQQSHGQRDGEGSKVKECQTEAGSHVQQVEGTSEMEGGVVKDQQKHAGHADGNHVSRSNVVQTPEGQPRFVK